MHSLYQFDTQGLIIMAFLVLYETQNLSLDYSAVSVPIQTPKKARMRPRNRTSGPITGRKPSTGRTCALWANPANHVTVVQVVSAVLSKSDRFTIILIRHFAQFHQSVSQQAQCLMVVPFRIFAASRCDQKNSPTPPLTTNLTHDNI